MSRRRADTTDTFETTQTEPTAERPVDGQGRTLDRWGLPITGPARIAALEEIGKPDPYADPEAWGAAVDEPAADDAGTEGN